MLAHDWDTCLILKQCFTTKPRLTLNPQCSCIVLSCDGITILPLSLKIESQALVVWRSLEKPHFILGVITHNALLSDLDHGNTSIIWCQNWKQFTPILNILLPPGRWKKSSFGSKEGSNGVKFFRTRRSKWEERSHPQWERPIASLGGEAGHGHSMGKMCLLVGKPLQILPIQKYQFQNWL